MNREEIKKKLQESYKTLRDVRIALKEENSNGNQFDYCTDSQLSQLATSVESEASLIHGIVYQGN